MRTGLDSEIALQMETDYGGIGMQIDTGDDNEIIYIICIQRNCHYLTGGGIKVHLARKHKNIRKHYESQRHCPRGLLEDHVLPTAISIKQCVHITENIRNIHWGDVWGESASKTTIRHPPNHTANTAAQLQL